MKLRIFTEPQQGSTYEELLTVARTAERLGFDAFFRSDHYLRISEGDPGPGSSDAWVTLAGLARDTSTIRLGTLVSPATFRLPGPLAISVAQVDQMSGGRVELGLGTGWFDAEHTAYGIPFPPVGERFSRFEEQLEIITGLWSTPPGETFSFEGAHYRLADSPALPKPVQSPRPPIIIGGFGATRTPRLAARFADEYNLPFHDLGDTELAFDRVRKACEAAGRDPIVLSVAQTVAVGADEAEAARRARAAGHDLAALRANGLAGTPAEVAEKIGRFAELGAEHLYLQVMDLSDLDHLELIAAEVLPHV
ncbi:LLM class F420-dependent oxidoreductase [Streptosporangium sandarakinum]|uniref:F420-dependent oxidoreductase-like protein n=1 Tax=Streptosporangium sandarakinum TaxID=1260955 RepID=A0A852V129_9ACTN|nr:LLM class F420-dependent oxidoreductase [Streptosporangium sandarakinum]NYF43472.1 F420-dependent oxidoreductase-like protein [Streptosporangium sandarakinum]